MASLLIFALIILSFPAAPTSIPIRVTLSLFITVTLLLYHRRLFNGDPFIKTLYYTILLTTLSCVLSTMYSGHPLKGILDWARQFFILILSLTVYISLYYIKNIDKIVQAIRFFSIIHIIYVLYFFYDLYGLNGLNILTRPEGAKFDAFNAYGVNLNSLSINILISFAIGFPIYDNRQRIKFSNLIILSYILFLIDSRGTLLSLALAVISIGILRIMFRAPSLFFTTVLPLVVGIFSWGFYQLLNQSALTFLQSLSEITTGRAELWIAAVLKFTASPLLGWGAESWNTDLGTYLKLYGQEWNVFDDLEAGGFHSAYLTLLAEKGLIGILSYIPLIIYFWKISIQRFNFQGSALHDQDHANRYGTLIFFIMLYRGMVEHGGLIGYANAASDYLMYIAIALLGFSTFREGKSNR